MNVLSVEQLHKSFSERILINSLTFGISQGQKVALVGKNGCGKSTLMKMIAGKEDPDGGKIVFRKGVNVRYLPQNPDFGAASTVHAYLFNADNEILHTIYQYEQALETGAGDLSAVIERMDHLQAWDYEHQIKEILDKLEVPDLDASITSLSGGQAKRVALAKVLIDKPDFLILDEPTNHLDITAIEWIEIELDKQNTTLLMVTHDRYFLDRVCNHIIELENGNLFSYQGNFSFFLEKKSERAIQLQGEKDKARNLYKKELEWMRRQPKARGTKAKYRVDAFQNVKDKAHQNLEEKNVQLQVSARRQGGKILEIKNLFKSYGDKTIVKNFSYTFKKKDRIALVGPNGVGKTTLLNILTGLDKDITGEMDFGQTTEFGYFHQNRFDFKDDQRVIDVVKDVSESIELANGKFLSASQFLQQFLFSPEMQYTYVEKLSGGEKKRLQLLRVLIKNPNFLILDEPTNDLDIYTLAVLEEFLMNFSGCLIIVSHDRFFMDRLVDHTFGFKGQGIIEDFPGNYSMYRLSLEEINEASPPENESIQKPQKVKREEPKTKLSFKEKKEFESLEKEIERLEDAKKKLIYKMNEGSGNHEELTNWGMEVEELSSQIEEKSLRWMELAEYAN